MARRWIVPVLALLLLLTGCGSVGAIHTDPVPPNRYDSGSFAVADGFLVYEGDAPSFVGVDVSSYQGEIDWPAVAAAGVEFAMVRVGLRGYTEGGLMEDTRYRQNIEGALAAGLDVGVYFFSQAVSEEEALEEADFLLERIGDYDITYPVVFDWERQRGEGSRTAETAGKTVTDCTVAFCAAVAEAGYRPMVYFSPSKAYTELDLTRLLDWPFWLAHYTEDWQATSFRYHFAMWQYSCQGQVDGIRTPVDLNLCLTDLGHEQETGEQ